MAESRWRLRRQFLCEPLLKHRQIVNQCVEHHSVFDPVTALNDFVAQSDGECNFEQAPTKVRICLHGTLACFAKNLELPLDRRPHESV